MHCFAIGDDGEYGIFWLSERGRHPCHCGSEKELDAIMKMDGQRKYGI